MTKQYNLKVSVQTAKPRSKRLRLSGGTARSEISSAGIYESGLDLSRYLEKEVFDDLFEKVQVNGQWVIRAKYGFYSNQFISALGLVQGNLGGGTGTGGSLFGLMRSWPSVDPGPSTQEALGANLGWELRGRIAALETAGFATQNWVLNKNYLTAHQDISHLLSKTEAASLYQPKGNYLTSHQSLSHLLNKNEGMYFLKNSQDAYIGARFYNADLARVAAAKYIEFWQSGYGWFKLQAGKFITQGGTSAQFVKGDGSLDSNTYALASALGNYYTKTEVNTKLTDGSVTKVGTATVGASNWPIYLNNGVPYACAWKFGNYNGAAAVNNGTLNENLNADLLDGLHYTAFSRADQSPAVDLNTINGFGIMCNPANANATAERHYPIQEAGSLFYGTGAYGSANQIYGGFYSNRWFARGGGSGVNNKTSWREFAFTNSNVASASRLQTTGTYTAWGQTYFANGVPQSVSGNMSGVGIIKFSAGNEIAFANSRFCFGATNQSAAQGVNVGSLLVSNAWADYTKVPVNGIYIKGALRIGDITIEEDKANGGLKISGGVYATKYVSALGLATGNLSGGSSGGGTAYDRLDAWGDYTTDKAGYVLSAGLGADLNSRVGANATSINSILSRLNSLEGGGTTSVTVTGSGNAITDISKGGTAIIATKGATFLTQHQALDHINVKDIRNTAPKPNDYVSNRLTAWFNNYDKPVAGLSEWYSGINVLGWVSSNYASWQLAATATTYLSDNNLYFRVGLGASWEAWQKILTSANYASVLGSVYQAKGSYFTNQGHLTNKDFDTIFTSGAGYIDATSTNKPSTISYGQLLTLHGGGDTITQMAFDYANSGNVWVRSGNPSQVGGTGTWKPWVQMLTATNYASTLDSHYVTLGTAQTVTGAKTFTGGLLMPYSAGTWISMPKRANQILGAVPTEGSSAHSLFTLLNSTGAAISYGGLGVNIGFYGFYKARMDSGANSYDWATTWNVNTGRLTHSGDLVAHSFIKNGGTASQFLKADGSVDGNSYALASALSNYYTKTEADSRSVKKAGDTMTGALTLPKLNIVGTAASSAYLTADSATNAFVNVGGKSIMAWDSASTSVRPGPSQAGQASLGTSAIRWSNVYATTINVTSTGLVSNLNADMLDGKHLSDILASNVASATKLQTARSLWGQSFDGSANVSGNMTGVGSITGTNYLINDTARNPYLKLTHDSLAWHVQGWQGKLFIGQGSAHGMQIDRNGRVGIKLGSSASPAYDLDVTGTGRFTGELQVLRVYASNWFRSTGNTGWYNETHGGGIYMTDSNWVRVYNDKAFRVQNGYGIGANGFNVGVKIHGTNNTGVEVSGGNYSMGLGCHSNGSWYWWRGTANPDSADNKSYVMQYDGSVWNFTGQLRCDSLRIGDAIFSYDAAHNGIKLNKGLYSEGYLSALGLSELTNTKFTISAGYESDALTILNGGIYRSEYWGDEWNKGHGALNVAIHGSSASQQTPLLLAVKADTPKTGWDAPGARLFAMELLDNGEQMKFQMGGSTIATLHKTNGLMATTLSVQTIKLNGGGTLTYDSATGDLRINGKKILVATT